MGMLVALFGLMLPLQDSETRYREGLYFEVDKGDLDRALELYRAVEADGSAPEAIRAKACFRRAWCLEKKGQKSEAEKVYREVASRFPGQAETVQRARERLDRPGAVDGSNPVPPIESRVSDLILSLGSGNPDVETAAIRSLSLIGEPAVPALRQALKHKDPTLAAMAAYSLLLMERDEGTYAPLMVWVRQGHLRWHEEFTRLLERRPELMKEFLDEFRKTDQGTTLRGMSWVLRKLKDREALQPRLRQLILTGTMESVQTACSLLTVSEEQFFSLLEELRAAPEGPARIDHLLEEVHLTVSDVPRLGKALLAIYPEGMTRQSLEFLGDLAPLHSILRECAMPWLTRGTAFFRLVVHWAFDKLDDNERSRLILHLLGGELPPEERSKLILRLVSLKPEEVIADLRPSLEKQLWIAFDREKKDLQAQVAERLLQLVPETHGRWEDLIRLEIDQFVPPQAMFAHMFGTKTEWYPNTSAIPYRFESWSADGKAKVRRLMCRRLLEGDPEGRRKAKSWLNQKPYFETADPQRNETLAAMALDPTLPKDLRAEALSDLYARYPDVPKAKEAIESLLKDPEPDLRKAAAHVVARSRGEATDALLAPLIADPSAPVAKAAVDYFAVAPREGFLHPLVQALGSRDSGVRATAAGGLGRSELISVVPDLLKHLDDPDGDVRTAVRAALQRIRSRYEEQAQWLEWYERVKPKEKK